MTSFIPKRNHLSLGRDMFRRVKTANFPNTIIRYQNTAWATHLGFEEDLKNDDLWCRRFARFTPLEGSFKAPLALAYHGHQFGVYVTLILAMDAGYFMLRSRILKMAACWILALKGQGKPVFTDSRWPADVKRGGARNPRH